MPASQSAKLSPSIEEVERELGHGRQRIEAAFVAAVELANAAARAIDIAPRDLDPIVLRRYHLAELAAARDAFIDAAGDLLVGEVPAGQTSLDEEPRHA